MKKRRTILIGLLTTVLLTLACWFEPTHCVRGKLRGEAFFDDRPTSYWRGIVVEALDIDWATFPRFTWWDRVRFRMGWDQGDRTSLQLAQSLDADSVAVLEELSRDTNPKVAAFASDLLELNRCQEARVYPDWILLLKKHNMR